MRAALLASFVVASIAVAAEPPKGSTPSAAQSWKKLGGKVTVDFKDVTLDAALAQISEQIQDQKLGPIIPLYAAPASKALKVTYAGSDVTVDAALDALLKPHGLGYLILSKPNDRQDGWFEFAKGTHRGTAVGKGVEAPAVAVEPEPKPVPKPTTPEPKPEPATAEDEAAAATRLESAKKLIAEEKATDAAKVLKYVVKYYPGTKAAGEAKELLEKMK